MKRIVTALLFAAASYSTMAQTDSNAPYPVRPRLNADLEFSIPGGEYGKQFGYGFGGSGGLDIPVTKSLYATGAAGVMSFYQGGKETPVETRTYIPMKAGAKYYFSPVLYAQMELGTGLGIQQGAGTVFIMTPGAGASWRITSRSAINTGIRFESWTREGGNISQLTFKVGYQF